MAYVDINTDIELSINKDSTVITREVNKPRQPAIINNSTNWNFTHDYVLRWLKGKCKEVILIGCADFENKEHYNTKDKFDPSITAINKSIKFIENEASIWYNVYKANPKGILNIPVRNINDI